MERECSLYSLNWVLSSVGSFLLCCLVGAFDDASISCLEDSLLRFAKILELELLEAVGRAEDERREADFGCGASDVGVGCVTAVGSLFCIDCRLRSRI